MSGRDRIVSIAEAPALSIVALTAAWSGYAAAKWSTESRVGLAEASTARTKANRAISGPSSCGTSTPRPSRRGSPPTRSTTSRRCPRGASLPAPVPGRLRRLARNEARDESEGAEGPDLHAPVQAAGTGQARSAGQRGADQAFAGAADGGGRLDKYVRTTVFLASVLFLVGISAQFPYAVALRPVGWAPCCWSLRGAADAAARPAHLTNRGLDLNQRPSGLQPSGVRRLRLGLVAGGAGGALEVLRSRCDTADLRHERD